MAEFPQPGRRRGVLLYLHSVPKSRTDPNPRTQQPRLLPHKSNRGTIIMYTYRTYMYNEATWFSTPQSNKLQTRHHHTESLQCIEFTSKHNCKNTLTGASKASRSNYKQVIDGHLTSYTPVRAVVDQKPSEIEQTN